MRATAEAQNAAENASVHVSKLLPGLFNAIGEDQRVNVLHIGATPQDTLDFFGRYRCKLHIRDLFADLPILQEAETKSEDSDAGNDPELSTADILDANFSELLQLPDDTQFDICLFWDIFNFLSPGAMAALMRQLRPHLHAKSTAHAFAMHNLRSPRANHFYGVQEYNALRVKERIPAAPGYMPHSQQALKRYLTCFRIDRTVLLPDSRLELLLRSKCY